MTVCYCVMIIRGEDKMMFKDYILSCNVTRMSKLTKYSDLVKYV